MSRLIIVADLSPPESESELNTSHTWAAAAAADEV